MSPTAASPVHAPSTLPRNTAVIQEQEDREVVVFAPDDPEEPKNWSPGKKKRTLTLACLFAFCGVFGSAIWAPGESEVRAKYGVNADVSSTGLSVYVLGLGLGPLIWGPLSELLGRGAPYHISWVIFAAAAACSAFIENIVAILIFRLIMGCAASSTITIGPAVVADIYMNDPHAMGLGMSFMALCGFAGPCLATFVGFLIEAHVTHGLWVLKVQFFFAIAVWPLLLLFPESYAPVILERRAKRLRKSGSTNAVAPHELDHKTVSQLVRAHVVRPFSMIVYEPIVQGAAVWTTITYGILYFFFEVYPVVFIVQHGLSFEICGALFLFILLGMVLSVATFKPLIKLAETTRLPFLENANTLLPIEETHLKVVLPACLLLPVSLFWLAWSSGPETHYIVAALSGVPFGFANTSIFFAFFSYTSRVYSLYSSSASAANTLFRSVVASIFPIVAHSITGNLGTKWGVTVFAFISTALIPIPFLFVRFGPRLREASRHASEARLIIAHMHENSDSVAEGSKIVTVVDSKDGEEKGSVV